MVHPEELPVSGVHWRVGPVRRALMFLPTPLLAVAAASSVSLWMVVGRSGGAKWQGAIFFTSAAIFCCAGVGGSMVMAMFLPEWVRAHVVAPPRCVHCDYPAGAANTTTHPGCCPECGRADWNQGWLPQSLRWSVRLATVVHWISTVLLTLTATGCLLALWLLLARQ